MNRIDDELDRILASEEPLLPSSGFAAAVGDRVRAEASALRPLPFPWLRFALGLAVLIAVSAAVAWTTATRFEQPLAELANTLATALTQPQFVQPFALVTGSLLGTLALVRLTLRMARPRV